jgi:winged helix DNA-binding protein
MPTGEAAVSVPGATLAAMGAAEDVLGERFARQGLADRTSATPLAATALTTALQAQDAPAARLGVRARAVAPTERDVLAAIEHDRTIVRTWLMRGTIHLVPSSDLRWLVRLIGPAIARKYGTRWRQIGLSDELLARIVDALPAVLAAGPLTRHQISAALAERGVALDSPDPQAPTHAIVHASTTGLICRGPDRGRHSTFALVDDWLPGAPAGPSGDDALAELARRYFAAFSPATAADFATWSGLPAGRAVALIRDELTGADVDGRAGFRLGEVEPARGLRLLPAFDNYLVGYRHRGALLTPEQHGAVFQGGMIRPAVLLDGRVVGTWALRRARGTLTVTPFGELTRADRDALAAEAADVERFVGTPLTLEMAA